MLDGGHSIFGESPGAEPSRPARDGTQIIAGPVLQLFRTTDNDKGFGKWLARDWREAGLTNLSRHVDSFAMEQTKAGEVKIKTVVTSSALSGGYKMKTAWMIRGDGSVEMDITRLIRLERCRCCRGRAS